MYLSKVIPVKLYDTTIQFIISDDIAKVYNRIQKKHNTNARWENSPAGGMLSLSMDRYHVLINSEYLSYNTILHELFHLVKGIGFDRNIFEEEPLCWLQGMIGQEIFKFLEQKKVKIN